MRRLRGDFLIEGKYEPIAIETLQEGMLRGYSVALGLYVCWEDGRLRFFDPGTESYLRSHDEDATRAEEEHAERMAIQARAEEERAGRLAAQARAAAAEARAAELEAELRRLRGE